MPISLSSVGVSLDDSIPENPSLLIPFNAVSTAISWNDPPTELTGFDPWLTGILQTVADAHNSDTSTNNIVVSQPSKRLTSRGNQPAIAYSYTVTVFVPDSISSKPDGDDL